jgi:hypothetical protein
VKDYSDIGLNQNIQNNTSLAVKVGNKSSYQVYTETPRGAVKSIHTNKLYDISNVGSTSNFGCGTIAVITSKLHSRSGDLQQFDIHEFSFYTEGTVTTNTHIWGNGTVNDWDFEIHSYNDWGLTNNKNLQGIAALRVLGGSSTIAFRNQWRFIIPPGGAGG